MLFSENERRELAEFFAKRFSEPQVRSMLARQAGIKEDADPNEPKMAWEALITTAQNRRKLPKLAIVAARTDQADQNLQAVCNLLGARARIVRNRVMTASAAASIALGFGWAGFNLATISTPEAMAQVVELEVEVTPEVIIPTPEVIEAMAEVVEEEPIIEDEGPGYLTAHTAPDDRPNGPAWRNGRCSYDKDSDFIGYWYAGADLPGRKGEVITVTMGVNVRKDYPGTHNNFDKRAKVRCILKRGDQVKLTEAPVLVPGDKFWVPLFHGDLVEEAPPENLVAVR
jgi:hypothetical protein